MGILTGNLLRLVFGGSLHTNEEWACSMHLTGEVDGDFTFTDLTPLVAPLTDWFKRPESLINQNARLDFVKLNQVNKTDGLYTNLGVSNTLVISPSVTPAGDARPCPGQITSAVSLLTDVVRGPAHKGRFFPPAGFMNAGGATLGADGRLPTAQALGMANSSQELCSEINALFDLLGPWGDPPSTKFVLSVWSQAFQTSRAVERTSVGRVPDTQRRRRSSLAEEYQNSAAAV